MKMRYDRQVMYGMALLMLLAAVIPVGAMVPAHPLYQDPPAQFRSTRIEGTVSGAAGKTRVIPKNILVLRVQFSDVRFQTLPAYPDSLVH
ncbi:MAG: hypothetical protein FJ042_05045, partial [Candidatus Cloacimonetes bacterium]|nr:hypothetical protein [Candidatus Cloacimonadota bacterium]